MSAALPRRLRLGRGLGDLGNLLCELMGQVE
jgi:hypothetical protein